MNPRRCSRTLAGLLQLFAILLSLQLAGVAELAVCLTDEVRHDCSNEQSGRDCPPGCPSCTCAHGTVGSIPAPAPAVPTVTLPRRPEAVLPQAALELQTLAELPHVYRPPRA